jgi:hypothetical protein
MAACAAMTFLGPVSSRANTLYGSRNHTGGAPVATFRFLASLFALIAAVALVADATPAWNGSGPFTAHSVINYWSELAPASLVAMRANITQMTAPWVWNPLLLSVLSFPMSALFAGLAIVCGYFGRHREKLKVHVN